VLLLLLEYVILELIKLLYLLKEIRNLLVFFLKIMTFVF